MAWRLRPDDVTALAHGCSLFGSGGGGTTTMGELMLVGDGRGERLLASVDEVDPATPCFGAAFVGSTILLGERLPGLAPFEHLIAAAERWLGGRIPAVCSIEGGGLNSLVPFLFAGERTIVDADCTGRAVPELDQMSLFVDRVPGLVFTCDSGAGGVAVVQTDRAVDAERIIRSAIIQAGGVGAAVLAGFTVGDLREHAMPGHQRRALELGRAFLGARRAPLPDLAGTLGARVLTEGRVERITADRADPHVKSVEIAGPGGAVDRIITRSETLAVLSDGALLASAPAIIAILDAASREILQVTDLAPGRRIAALSLPAPDWWLERPERLRRVLPSAYGLSELDAA